MASTLAKELLRLNKPAPVSVDPEDEDFGAETRARTPGKAAVQPEDVVSPSRHAPEGRRLRGADTLANNPRYSGKPVNRASIFDTFADSDEDDHDEGAFDDEDEDDDEELTDQNDQESHDDSDAEDLRAGRASRKERSPAPFASQSDSSIESGESAQGRKPGASGRQRRAEIDVDEDSADDIDDDVDDDDDESEAEEEVLKLRGPKRQRQEPAHVKNQIALWSELVGFRIRMQGLLNSALRLPRGSAVDQFKAEDSGISTAMDKCAEHSGSILKTLLELRREANAKSSWTAANDADEEVASEPFDVEDTRALWQVVSKGNAQAIDYSLNTFDTWHRQVLIGEGKTLKAVNKSISEQVEAVTSGGDKVLARSQMRPGDTIVFGEAAGDGEEAVHDADVYNDQAFYQQLLLNFVSTTSGDSASRLAGLGDEDMSSRLHKKRNKKRKREVDPRASKGRKLRYNVHDKLVNFVAPKPMPEAPVDTDQLFQSLFAP